MNSAPGFERWLFLFLFAVLLLYYYFAGPNEGLSCPIYRISGWKCAGCGAQRALHALLHGRVREAFEDNPLFVLALPVVLGWTLHGFSRPEESRVRLSAGRIFLIGLILLAYMLLRNWCSV